MVKILKLRKVSVANLQNKKTALLQGLPPLSGLLRASFVKQFLTCGKKNCRCRRGFKHGPFFYLVQAAGGGRVRKFLLKTPEQRKQARVGIAAHLKWQRRLAEISEINTELLRRSAAGKKRAENS